MSAISRSILNDEHLCVIVFSSNIHDVNVTVQTVSLLKRSYDFLFLSLFLFFP